MAYDATVFRVMIASPSDVADEREIVRQVLEDWNTANSEKQRIVLRPSSWETDSAPSMRNRPQAIINEQVLDGCDLLVAVFWTRIGSPTGEADSGTVEELERHVAAGRPAMIYFSDAPMQPSRIDDEQREALVRFKADIRERGLFESFKSAEEFRGKFRRQLQKIIDTDPHFRSDGRSNSQDPEGQVPYLDDHERGLLVAAAASNGTITVREGPGHFSVQCARKSFGSSGPRDRATWRAIVRNLQEQGLIEDMTGAGNLFQVTAVGYEIADSLGSSTSDVLDETELRILQHLAANVGRKPEAPARIASVVGADAASCQVRLGGLEKRGLVYRHMNLLSGISYSIQQAGLEELQRLGKVK